MDVCDDVQLLQELDHPKDTVNKLYSYAPGPFPSPIAVSGWYRVWLHETTHWQSTVPHS